MRIFLFFKLGLQSFMTVQEEKNFPPEFRSGLERAPQSSFEYGRGGVWGLFVFFGRAAARAPPPAPQRREALGVRGWKKEGKGERGAGDL